MACSMATGFESHTVHGAIHLRNAEDRFHQIPQAVRYGQINRFKTDLLRSLAPLVQRPPALRQQLFRVAGAPRATRKAQA